MERELFKKYVIQYTGNDNYEVVGELVNGVDMASYNKGMEDAWAMAQKIHRMNGGDVEDAFTPDGAPFYHDAETAIRQHSVYEAKEKLEAWDKQHSKIKVGDEITKKEPPYVSGIVVDIDDGDMVWLLDTAGISFFNANYFKKTGNNYAAELRELLDKIGGGSDE